MNKNFPRYGVFPRKLKIMMFFIAGYFHQKVIKFYENSKNVLQNPLLSLSSFSKSLLWYRISKKTKEWILRKVGYSHTYRPTKKDEFIRPPLTEVQQNMLMYTNK